MKKLAQWFTLSATLSAGVCAAPFLAVGDGAEIFLTGDLKVRADSNIFLASDTVVPSGRSDTVFEAAPGLELVFGKNAAVQGSWSVKETFLSYADHDSLNSNLFSTIFGAGFTDGKTKGAFNASYIESDQNQETDLVTGPILIHRNTTSVGANGEISATEKTSVGVGVQYDQDDYQLTGYFDRKTFTVPVNYYYELTPKVDVSVGYRYRSTEQAANVDSKDHFFNVGARGQFTPKFSGRIALGVTQRKFGSSDETLFGVDSSFSYAASEKTSLQFGVSNDFDTTAQAQQQKNLSIRTSIVSNLTEQWSVSTGLTYRAINYYAAKPPQGPHTDDYVDANLGATYIYSKNIRITGAYTYRNNRSAVATNKFDDNVLSVTANFRY